MTDMTQTTPRWHRMTRWLHGLIAVGITSQLVLSLIMVAPDEVEGASALEAGALELHEWIGLATVAVMLAHWLWLLKSSSDVHVANLFPFGKAGRAGVMADLKYLMQNKQLPPVGQHGGLSGLVHGLGFLVATVMALTGLGLYIVLDFAGGEESSLFEPIAGVHELFGNLMWAYLVGHFLMAVWHEFKGERLIAAMFRG